MCSALMYVRISSLYFIYMQPTYFDAALHTYIQKICNCTNFKVNASLLKCVDDGRALYAVQLIGPMINKILKLWSDEIENSQGIDITVGTISLCNSSCFIYDQRTSKSTGTMAATYLIVIFTILSIFTNNFDSFTCLPDKRLEMQYTYTLQLYKHQRKATNIATYIQCIYLCTIQI